MTRKLLVDVLDGYAVDCASWWMRNIGGDVQVENLNSLIPLSRAWIRNEFYKFIFKDEFDYLWAKIANKLNDSEGRAWDEMVDGLLKSAPRTEKVFHKLLKDKLAICPEGEHISGKIGTTITNGRDVGYHVITVEAPDSIARRRRLGLPKTEKYRELVDKVAHWTWNIYAGEESERQVDSGVADPIPPYSNMTPRYLYPAAVGALNTRVSNESVLLGANALVDNLDEGSAGATIQGRDGAQPADPDTTVTGTNGFTMTASTTAFGAASDAAPGALKTAAAVTDDSSADATITLGYIRASSSNAADTPLDDHIDGEAGTSGADWNFNTLSIVSGSTVSTTSWTCTLPES